jgi:hypothetical protein
MSDYSSSESEEDYKEKVMDEINNLKELVKNLNTKVELFEKHITNGLQYYEYRNDRKTYIVVSSGGDEALLYKNLEDYINKKVYKTINFASLREPSSC